ncbi:hypothetical protein SAY87_008339 [Trapa incisa]|uniref:non-specific serine/threonine protein kinase n=1 Tax=Trapa incisa TaxID=236973 RepID=A0AAN7QFZ0_9MYRT|nr:hypothetical protein SAY87_008339 [Trapa incisa]
MIDSSFCCLQQSDDQEILKNSGVVTEKEVREALNDMGICWGAPDYPSPSFNGYLKPGLASLSFSSTSSSENGLSTSLGGRPTEVVPDVEVVPPPNVRVFTYKELQKATRNFKPDSNIGEGAFGVVYKGFLDEGFHGAIAVKKLNAESVQGFKEWKSEINFLGTLSHPNIVKLLGYCSEDGHLLLVYEYMSKGTLKNHLFRRASTETLPWTLRIQIATGAARGLAFLHQLDRQIICRDFKPSNILLDGDLNARISDFGLARAGPSDDRSHVSTQVVGTYGYAAPEYIATACIPLSTDGAQEPAFHGRSIKHVGGDCYSLACIHLRVLCCIESQAPANICNPFVELLDMRNVMTDVRKRREAGSGNSSARKFDESSSSPWMKRAIRCWSFCDPDFAAVRSYR